MAVYQTSKDFYILSYSNTRIDIIYALLKTIKNIISMYLKTYSWKSKTIIINTSHNPSDFQTVILLLQDKNAWLNTKQINLQKLLRFAKFYFWREFFGQTNNEFDRLKDNIIVFLSNQERSYKVNIVF